MASLSHHFRLAHISDLHFAKASFDPGQFFSKRWIGNVNLLFSRQRDYLPENLAPLPSLFQELKVDLVLITGDLSTTSQTKEFALARKFLQEIEARGISTLALPGNHDHYTKRAYKNRLFYHYFKSFFSQGNEGIFSYNLKEHKVAAKPLPNNWWMVALDTALATPLFSSRGLFSLEDEKSLYEVLSLIPPQHSIIIANHFPLFPHESQRKTLVRSEALQELLRSFPNVKMYLHGHTHRHCLADLRANRYPIVMDSGSTSHRERGTFNLIDINGNGCKVNVYQCSSKDNPQPWNPVRDAAYLWK